VATASSLEEANAQLLALHEELEKKATVIEELRAQLELMKRQMFGRRREKLDPHQLRFFEQGQAILDKAIAEHEELQQAKKPKPAKKGHGRPPFAPDLPREDIELDVPAEDRCCDDCGEGMRLIGVEVTERGHLIPAHMIVRRYQRAKYACPHGHGIKTASLPDGVVDKGKYEASVYAFVATSKYADHIPLHRLQGILKRHGAHLAKQTMWDMMDRLDDILARPILKQMHQELLEEEALQADETTVKVQIEGQKGSSRGILWAWRNVRGSPQEKVVAEFRDDRSAKGPDAFLGDWSGVLLTDGFDGVNPAANRNDIARAGCWAHARRKFRDALQSNGKKASAVLRPIQRLFWIESAITARAKHAGLDLEGLSKLRLEVRGLRSRRVLKQIYELGFALDEDPSVTGKNLLRKAVTYLINQREGLTAMLRHGIIPIHNNDTERDLRHVVTGRKNWGHFASRRGGVVAGRLYSLTMSCKLNGLNVTEYIEDVLGRISTTPASEIAKLTPWGWAAERARERQAAQA